ncbi:hypothetical protein [Pseudomonas sp.]|uniref:hypothetical protein n=1 Tax=Pseudomonas sp. TaxID=306 RepID=UPI0019DD9E45|nr:hypothetical protein [Pseudomonas sp.]MBF0675558.1 hypothetical protein [Pseudomonas sp.]
MGDQVRKAIEQLFAICLELSATGRYQAFFEWQAHVSQVRVEVYPGGTRFEEGEVRRQIFEASIYVAGRFIDQPGEIAKQLNGIAGKLNLLLMEDAA